MVTAPRERGRERVAAATLSGERERSRVVNDAVYCPEERIFCCESPIRGRHAASRLSSRLPSPSYPRPRTHRRTSEGRETNENPAFSFFSPPFFFLFFRECHPSRGILANGVKAAPIIGRFKHAPRGLMHIIASIMRLLCLVFARHGSG